MQEIRLQLSDVVVKFLAHHMQQVSTYEISQKSIVRQKIVSLLREEKTGQPPIENYNIVINLPYYSFDKFQLGVDVRSRKYFISERRQKQLDKYLKSFIRYDFFFWCLNRKKAEPKLLIKDLIYQYRDKYGMTEEEFSFRAMEEIYKRNKKRMNDPHTFFMHISRLTITH